MFVSLQGYIVTSKRDKGETGPCTTAPPHYAPPIWAGQNDKMISNLLSKVNLHIFPASSAPPSMEKNQAREILLHRAVRGGCVLLLFSLAALSRSFTRCWCATSISRQTSITAQRKHNAPPWRYACGGLPSGMKTRSVAESSTHHLDGFLLFSPWLPSLSIRASSFP